MRTPRLAPLVAALAVSVLAAPQSGALTSGGLVVPNTSTARNAQLVAPASVVRALATPGSPDDDDPAALARLGSPNSPQDDLADALDALAAAADESAASSARQFAVDVLEGNPIPGRVYSGIPLLNWNVAARVKTVPAGGTVTVTEVRFGQRSITDTALLQFDDPNQPFTIDYRVAELGTSTGGVFSPAPLLAEGANPIGGLASVVQPLSLRNLATGTTDTNRFHTEGASELTRTAVQRLEVRMPPPRLVTAILNPDVRPGHAALSTLAPATPERIAALHAAYGFTGSTPTATEKAAAIAKLAPAAPAKLLWSALTQLDPSAPGFLAAARAAGTSGRLLVDAMVTRTALPAGVPTSATATLGVVLAGGEAYVSRATVAARGAVTIAVTNADGFAHAFSARVLHSRNPVHGALDWGEFQWTTAATATLTPGEQRTFTVRNTNDPFALWVGDPDGGDQAAMVVGLDSGPALASIELESNIAVPSHFAQDASGHLWVALAGTDTIVRITPADDVSQSTIEQFRLPGGNTSITSTAPPLAPHDLVVDGHGIVWATLAEGNAIARFDPAAGHAGTSDGFRIYPLAPCVVPAPACAVPFPPPPPGHPPISRDPNQMKVLTAPNGDTILWFTESNADAIGALRASPDGTLVEQADVPCGCNEPLGIALGADGAVWFSVLAGNEVVRLTPSPSRPFDAAAATFDRFPIPSSVEVIDPAHPAPGIHTAGAHSLAIDTRGRVWVTEEETAKVGFLDPAIARPGSTAGFTEFPLGVNDFGSEIEPADLTIDANGTVFWVDEYGDAVGSVTATGAVTTWRPAERASQTDSPFIDHQGNLWFAEAGANLLTRLSRVAAPSPLPAPPPTIAADVAAGTVHGTDLSATTSVNVEVVRGSTTVARITGAGVTGGAFTAATPGVTGGDRVRVTRHGTVPQAALTFTVASISVAAAADGTVAGSATLNGQPLTDAVTLAGATLGNATTLPLDPRGAFHTKIPPGTTASVSWTGATVAALFRTVVAFATAAPVPPPPPLPPVSPPAPPIVAPPAAPSPPPAPEPLSPLARACTGKMWLVEGDVPLLGLRLPQVDQCLGRATRVWTRRGVQTRRYGNMLDVHLRHGAVTSFTVRSGRFTTATSDVRVGSPMWKLSLALRKVRFDPSTRRYRAVVALDHGRFADIRVPTTRSRSPRVRPFTVALVAPRHRLDRFARRYLL